MPAISPLTRRALLACVLALAACSGSSGKPPGPICGSGCLVDGRCVAEGDACDDGLFCTIADRCFAGRCTGVPRDCDDRIDCNGTETCDEGARACRPGTPTCVPGEVCDATQDRCVRPCLGCLIDGVCWRDGQVDPQDQCLGCDTSRAQFAWSARDGLPCDDGQFCTVGDVCTGGTCAGTARSCSDGLACNGVETCDEAAKACRAGTSPCGVGEVCDAVSDACTRLVCTAGCLVANVCWGAGQVNPGNPCLVCDPARSTAAWSARDGVACDDGRWCTVNDTCSGGTCAGVARTCSDGRACNGVETCDEATDSCTPHPVAGCESSAACADACTQLGQILPYFVATIEGSAAPTQGGTLLTLVGWFPDLAGATLVDQATGASLAGGVVSWTQDRIQLLVPAGARDREIVFTAAGGTPVPYLEEVVTGWARAFVQRATFPIRYAPPIVTRAAGCVDDDATTALSCSVWGQAITVYGTNLGDDASAIQVDVGGHPCGSVALVQAHARLTCALPASPAGGFDLPVTVTVGGRSGTRAGALSYFGPEIHSVSAPPLDTLGTSVVEVGGRFFGTDVSAVEVQLGDDPELVATPLTLSQEPMTLLSTLTFRAPPGVGAGWPVSVKVGALRTRPSVDTVSYLVPEVLGSTVRGSLGGAPSTAYTLPALPGSVFFDVLHAGPRPGALAVSLVVPGAPPGGERPCIDPVLVPSNGARSTLACRVPTNLSVRGVPMPPGLVVQIAVRNAVSAEGSDLVNLPQCATLSGVSGCVDAGSTTVDCPTEGGVAMSARGVEYLGDAELLTVGAEVVEDVVYVGTTVHFVLPPGIGSVPVVLRNGGCCSAPRTIEYGAPVVAAVSGCVDWQGKTGDCPVAGGTTLTITGSNFGAAGATVLVGAARCASVAHDPVDPHHRLTCVLPAGVGQDLPVLVVNGQISVNAGSLSYRVP